MYVSIIIRQKLTRRDVVCKYRNYIIIIKVFKNMIDRPQSIQESIKYETKALTESTRLSATYF